MKHLFISLALFFSISLLAQPKFSIELENVTIKGSPGIHSFIHAHHDGHVLIIGGRTDGLHKRRPFEAFLKSDNNTMITVLSLKDDTFYTADLKKVGSVMYEQLQSTNMEFEQVGDKLYAVGGYGYSDVSNDHITYPSMVVIEHKKVIDAIIQGKNYSQYFKQMQNTAYQVTGGSLHHLKDTFYLVGGQKFMGRYNPMGPDHGPGFVQEYTNEIRKFTLKSDHSLDFYKQIRDTVNLHRRDFNVVKQVFPNGEVGLTAFTGVFQYEEDIPWLNVVDITTSGYKVAPDFEQKLSQYHCANLPVYDSTQNEMHTFFFGGMAQYTYRNNVMVEDTDVPFVNTISVVSRNAKGKLSEYKVGEMPSYLGSGAEFIPVNDRLFTKDGILKLNALNEGKVHVGYLFGGIESDEENIFFTFEVDKLSRATNKLFKVYVDVKPTSTKQIRVEQGLDFDLLYARSNSVLKIRLNEEVDTDRMNISIINIDGKVIEQKSCSASKVQRVSIADLPSGIYWAVLTTNGRKMSKPFRVF